MLGAVSIYFCEACNKPCATIDLMDEHDAPLITACIHCGNIAQSTVVGMFMAQNRLGNITCTHAWVSNELDVPMKVLLTDLQLSKQV